MVENFRTTMDAAVSEYAGQYDWLIVTHHKSTQTVAKHAADSDIENYVDAGFEQVMDEFGVDFVLGGHDHVYSRSYVLKDGERNAERLDTFHEPGGGACGVFRVRGRLYDLVSPAVYESA